MATNNFKAFALDPNANVMSQADWEALPALLSGFTAGKASSAQVNKAIRQATTIAALVGQFIANSGVDALDNADVNGLVTKFTNALTTNLGLGEAAKLAAPSGTLGQTGYTIFPLTGNKSLIFQWGLIGPSDSSTGIATASFPMAFPNGASLALVQELTTTTTGPIGVNSWGVSETTKTTLTAIVAARTVTNSAAVETGRYFAIGY